MLTEAAAVRVVREHFESLFPKVCPNCGRTFATLREYIQLTTRLGAAHSYDAELGDWSTREPIGSLAQASCPCGTTLSLGTHGMALARRRALLAWVKQQTEREQLSASDLLERMRDAIREQALGQPEP